MDTTNKSCITCAYWNTDACPLGVKGSPDWGTNCEDYIAEEDGES